VQPLLSSEIKTIRLAKPAGDNRGWQPSPPVSRGFLSIRNDPPQNHTAPIRSDGGAGQNSKLVITSNTPGVRRFSKMGLVSRLGRGGGSELQKCTGEGLKRSGLSCLTKQSRSPHDGSKVPYAWRFPFGFR